MFVDAIKSDYYYKVQKFLPKLFSHRIFEPISQIFHNNANFETNIFSNSLFHYEALRLKINLENKFFIMKQIHKLKRILGGKVAGL